MHFVTGQALQNFPSLSFPVAPPSSFSNLPEWPQPHSTVRKDKELVHVCLQTARYLYKCAQVMGSVL